MCLDRDTIQGQQMAQGVGESIPPAEYVSTVSPRPCPAAVEGVMVQVNRLLDNGVPASFTHVPPSVKNHVRAYVSS